MHKFLFYNEFISCLYMFRALCAHHQEVKTVLYSIWYRHTCRWLSCAQVERGLIIKPGTVSKQTQVILVINQFNAQILLS